MLKQAQICKIAQPNRFVPTVIKLNQTINQYQGNLPTRSRDLSAFGFAIFLACQLLVTCVCSKSVAEVDFEFMEDHWTVADGLPGNQCLSIAQSTDGYIWISTFYGLARFDGMKFTVFDASTPGIPPGTCYRIIAGLDGSIWCRIDQNLVRYSDGVFTTISSFQGDDLFRFYPLVAGPDDSLYSLGIAKNKTQAWIYRIDQDGTKKRVSVPSPSLFGNHQFQGSIDHKGNPWFRIGAVFGKLHDSNFEIIDESKGTETITRGPVRSKLGGFWLARKSILQRWDGEKWLGSQIELPQDFKRLSRILETPDGNLWLFGTGGTLRIYHTSVDDKKWHLSHSIKSGARANSVMDFEGKLWTVRNSPSNRQGSGLYRLRKRTFKNDSSAWGNSNTIRAFAQNSTDSIFVGSASGVYDIPTDYLENNDIEKAPIAPLTYGHCWSITSDENNLYIGGYNFSNKHLEQNKSPIRKLTKTPAGRYSLTLFPIQQSKAKIVAITSDKEGNVWGGNLLETGIFRASQSAFTEYAYDPFPVQSIVSALQADQLGRIWIGTRSQGLVRYANGKFHHFSPSAGGIDAKIHAIHIDAEDTLWLATGGHGLVRVRDGQFHGFSTRHGLPTNELNTVVDDQLGYLWFGSYDGIHRVAKKQLSAVAAGQADFVFARSFGLADGLSTLQCSYGHPASIRAQDGRLWFATVNGINIVDPGAIPSNLVPPKVILETLLLDGIPHNLHHKVATSAPMEFPSGVERIEFRYTGISFGNPENIRFRYQLEPGHSEWNELGFNRSVVLPKLSPGQYRFRVTAANSDGIWNEVGQSFEFQVVGQWWQRSEVRVSIAAALLGLVTLVVHLRSRQLRRRQAAKDQFARDLIEHQETDRQRIARELHDGLEQNLLVIKNQASQIQTTCPSSAVQQLQDISDLSSQSIAEVRQIANNLRPYQIDRLGLTKAMQGMLDQLNEATKLTVQHEIEAVPSDLSSETQINLYRILQETINNILKHAEATHVTVTLIVTARSLTLRVKDNGSGFEPLSLEEEHRHHFGVSGIAERTSMLGGSYELNSSPGFGTEWRVRVPCR